MSQALGALQPTVRIVEEPAAKELRFRYECECRSVGSIPGVNSTKKNPTYPTIRIENFTGQVTIVVSCVTQDQPYRPHPHSLVGRDGCEGGVCTIRAQVTETANEYSFKHLGIQCCRRNDIKKELFKRALMRVDPFGKLTESIKEWQNINLKAVRLVFQVFLHDPNGGDRMVALEPAVSNIIYDKKIANLWIVCAIGCSGPVFGGTHIGLLCEKVTSDDTVVIYDKDDSERVLWETTAKVIRVHKQVAIVFELPPYNPPYYKPDTHRGQITLNVQLMRNSDKERSNSVPFEYIPDFQGAHKRPKRIIPALMTFGAESTAPAPTYSQLQPAVSHSETQTVGKGSSLQSKLNSNQTYNKFTRAGELSPLHQNRKSKKSANKSHLNGVETTNAHGSPRKEISSLLGGISETPSIQETTISAHSTHVDKRLSTRGTPLSTHCPHLGWGGRLNSVHNSCLRTHAPYITKVAKVAPMTCSTQSNHNVKPNETVALPSNLGPSTVAHSQYKDGGGGISTAQRLLFNSQFVHSTETNQSSPVHGPPMNNLDEIALSNAFLYKTPSKNINNKNILKQQISINNSQSDSYVSNTDKVPFTYGSQANYPSSDIGGVNGVGNMYQQPVDNIDIHCNNERLLSVLTSHNNTEMGDESVHMSNIAEIHLPYEASLNPNLTNMGEMENLSSVYGLPFSESSQHTQKNVILTSMHTTTTSSDTQNNGHRLHQNKGNAGLPSNSLPLNSYSTELRKIDEVAVPSRASSVHLNQTCRPSMLTSTVNIGHEGHTMYPNKTPSYDPPVGAPYQNFDEVRGASSARTPPWKEQSQRPQETNTSFQSMNHQMEIESEEIVLLLNEDTAATLRDLSTVFSQDNCESLSESLRRLSTGNDNSD